MTTLLTMPSTRAAYARLSGHLSDALSEAVVLPPDPCARSAVICSLVEEMRASLEWRQGPLEELMSIQQLVNAAHEHQVRMTALALPGSTRTGGHRP